MGPITEHKLRRCVPRALSRLRDRRLNGRRVKRQLAKLRAHGIVALPPARWDGATMSLAHLVKRGRPTDEVTMDRWSIDGRTYRWERPRGKQVGTLRVI